MDTWTSCWATKATKSQLWTVENVFVQLYTTQADLIWLPFCSKWLTTKLMNIARIVVELAYAILESNYFEISMNNVCTDNLWIFWPHKTKGYLRVNEKLLMRTKRGQSNSCPTMTQTFHLHCAVPFSLTLCKWPTQLVLQTAIFITVQEELLQNNHGNCSFHFNVIKRLVVLRVLPNIIHPS